MKANPHGNIQLIEGGLLLVGAVRMREDDAVALAAEEVAEEAGEAAQQT